MKLTRIIIKFFSFLYYLVQFRHFKTAYLFANYHVSLPEAAKLRRKGNHLEFIYTGNTLPMSLLPVFGTGLSTLIQALNNKAVHISKIDKKGFTAVVNGLKFHINSVANMATLKEIFIDTLYGIKLVDKDNLVLDIGMNVGFASLYFAASDDFKYVYAYEPFKLTYEEAIANFGLNPQCKDKITAYDYGISNFNGTIEVPMLESGSAVSSTNQIFIEHNSGNSASPGSVSVNVKRIDEVLQSIISNHPSENIYLKIDCEGEEYNILQQLDEAGLLNKIKGFFMEWHIKGADELIQRLQLYHFEVLSLPINIDGDKGAAVAGMLYAFRK